MASVYETATTPFTQRRTRSGAPRALDDFGQVTGIKRLPNPIAVMQGPINLTGPGSAVGANEYWSVDIPVPAVPDVAWVLTNATWLLALDGREPTRAALHLFGQGNGGSAVTFRTPLGANTVTTYLASDGAYERMGVVLGQMPNHVWLPIDPTDTNGGWNANLVVQADGSGLSTNACFVNLADVHLVGFPISYWDNGALFMGGYGSVGV